MLDVAACNRELRNRVADRLELGLLRQFGGVGSQSDSLIHFWIQVMAKPGLERGS